VVGLGYLRRYRCKTQGSYPRLTANR
jgi:hypothetical protein